MQARAGGVALNTELSPVMALVDVIVEVLDCFDGGYNLNIDMTVKTCAEEGVVRDHPAIVELNILAMAPDCHSATVIAPAITCMSRCVSLVHTMQLAAISGFHILPGPM